MKILSPVLSFATFLILLVNFLGFQIFIFEIFSHFIVLYLVISLLLAACNFAKKHHKTLTINLLSLVICIVQVFPYLGFGKSEQIPGNFKVAEININRWSEKKVEAIEELRKLDASFLVMLEVNPAWEKEVSKLKDLYP
ncbi:MAG: hypothetical protein KBC84_07820, partial [Proteobacteria bacterium]|nr:hypothetical protein [Pseudomonadota bacterium]